MKVREEDAMILCGVCQGKRQWVALAYKRFARKALLKAALRGDSILPTSEYLWAKPPCSCKAKPESPETVTP